MVDQGASRPNLVTAWTTGRRRLGKDPVFGAWVKRFGTIRLEAYALEPFAYLARAICYQQLAAAAARTIHRRFVEALDGDVSPERVLRAPEHVLRGAGLSASKFAAIHDLATKISSGAVHLEDVKAQPDEEIVGHLTQVRGIGVWTAQMFLIFYLHRPDVWPTGDLGVRSGYAKAHGLETAPSARELEPLGDPYRPWRSVVAYTCWAIQDAGVT